MLDPQQELFSNIKKEIESLGYDVYDGFLPPENTPYPFVYLGDMQQVDASTKSQINGRVTQTIHVWNNNPKQRGTVSQMLLSIKKTCRMIKQTESFTWNVRNINQNIFPDNTTKSPLMHGVLDIEFYFS